MDDLTMRTVLMAMLLIFAALAGALVAALDDSPKTCKALLWVAALFAAPLLAKVWLALVLL